jgi:hypothetical protein
MRIERNLLLAALALGASFGAAPASAKATGLAAIAARPETLRPGQYVWNATPADGGGALTVMVDLTRQLAWVYRGAKLIGLSTISSGASGYETPTGSFTVLQKSLTHKSNLYDDAPMPFMQRLTWDGLALHAGTIPGHPASHGCVRLPKAFARLLYGATRVGTTVTITGDDPMLETEPVATTEALSDEDVPPPEEAALPYALNGP